MKTYTQEEKVNNLEDLLSSLMIKCYRNNLTFHCGNHVNLVDVYQSRYNETNERYEIDEIAKCYLGAEWIKESDVDLLKEMHKQVDKFIEEGVTNGIK